MTIIKSMAKSLLHITQIQILSNIYGAGVVAGLLGVTERAMQLWVSEPNRSPRKETLRKLGELFASHEKGQNIALNASEGDFRVKYTASIEKQNKILEEQVNFLKDQLRLLILVTQAKVDTNQRALADLLVKQKIEPAEKVEDRLSKENLQNCQRLKSEIGIL